MSTDNDRKVHSLWQEIDNVIAKLNEISEQQILLLSDHYLRELNAVHYQYVTSELPELDYKRFHAPNGKSYKEMNNLLEKQRRQKQLLKKIEEQIESSEISKYIAEL